MTQPQPIVIAEGNLRRLEELQRILAAESIPAEVMKPRAEVGNG